MATQPSLGNPMPMDQYISGVTDQAYQSWKNQQDQMDWAKNQFAGNQATAKTVQGQDLATSKAMQDASTSDRALYEGTYVPAMKAQMDYAMNYTTPDRMAANRGAAMTTANTAFDANADAAKRSLQSVGVDPSSGRFAGLDAGLAAARAKQAAAAGTTSDRTTEMLGQQYLANAIATGQVLPGQAVNEAGAGVAAGNAGVNTGLATTASGAATMGTPMQWNALGNDMYKQWLPAATAQTQAGLTQNRDTAEENLAQQKINAASSSGIGAALGAGAGILGGVLKSAGGLGGISDWIGGLGGSGGTSSSTTGGTGNSTTPGGFDPSQAAGPGNIPQDARGGMIRKMAKGGAAHDILGTIGSIGGNLLFPVIGGMAGKFLGNAAGDLIEGDTGNIGGDAERDFTFGIADPDKPGGVGMPSGMGGIGKLFGIGGGGGAANTAGADVTDAGSWGAGAGDVASGAGDVGDLSGFAFARGGDSNMVPPSASPSGGAQTDDVHALLNEGEFVMPKEVTSWLGEKYLQGLIKKAHEEMMGPKAEPEATPMPQAMAMSPPRFMSAGARAGA